MLNAFDAYGRIRGKELDGFSLCVGSRLAQGVRPKAADVIKRFKGAIPKEKIEVFYSPVMFNRA